MEQEMNHGWLKFLPSFLRNKLEGREVLQKTVANTGWLFADNILRMCVGFFVVIWVARYLGPEQFGIYNYAIAFAALFSAIATLGLDNIVVRDIVKHPESVNEILGTAFILKLIGGVMSLCLVMWSISMIRPDDALTRWMVGIIAAGVLFQAFDTIDFWFKSQIQSKFTVYAKNTAFLLANIGKVGLILISAPLIAFAWIGLIEVAIGSAGLLIAYRVRACRLMDWTGSLKQAKGLLKDSWPLILSGLAIMIYMRIDQIMLGEMVSLQEVGIYSVAVRLVEVWYFIPMVIFSSVFPSVVDAKEISEDLLYERMQKLYNLMALLAYAIAIPMTFLSGWVIKVLFGNAYSDAATMLSLLIWTVLFTNLGIARSSFLTAMNWTKTHFLTVFVGCIANVILNLVLIPVYGGLGAVIASCISYWLAAHGTCYFYKPLVKTGNMMTKAMIYPKVW